MIQTKKTRLVHFRLTNLQYEELLKLVQSKGYVTISQYLRHVALEKDLLFETKFNALYNKIMNKNKIAVKRYAKNHYTKQDFLI